MSNEVSKRRIAETAIIWGVPIFVWLLAWSAVVKWVWKPGQEYPYWADMLVLVAVGLAAAIGGARSRSKASVKRAALPILLASVVVGVVFARGYVRGYIGEGFVIGAFLAAGIQFFGFTLGLAVGWAWRRCCH